MKEIFTQGRAGEALSGQLTETYPQRQNIGQWWGVTQETWHPWLMLEGAGGGHSIPRGMDLSVSAWTPLAMRACLMAA